MKRQLQRMIVLLMGLITLIISFQNCGQASAPAMFSGKPPAASVDETEGTGGQPYDGKIYVVTGALCPDRTNIHARIILKSATSGNLVRENCQEITPVALDSNDFQLDPLNSDKIYFRTQTMSAEKLVDVAAVNTVAGFGYWLRQDFGTPGDSNEFPTRSLLRVFEDGVEIGPAHSLSLDIENLGQGRFSHWDGTTTALYLSATDNSDPRTNGRKYTYIVGP